MLTHSPSRSLNSLSDRFRHVLETLRADDPPSPDGRPVPVRQRLAVAVLIGLASGTFTWLMALRPGAIPDFIYSQAAIRIFLDGSNPYLVLTRHPGAAAPYDGLFFFPFTAVLVAFPFKDLPLPLASGLFFGISSALLAYAITRDGLWRVHVFASAPFVAAAVAAQFAPLIMVLAFLPGWGFAATLKPNLGAALLARRPTVRAFASAGVFLAASLVLFPSWPRYWLAALRPDIGGDHIHVSPALQLGGPLLLLAAVAWRRPSGRLLLAMSLVPQLLFFYDQLPLWLVPATRKQSIALTACSQLAFILWYLRLHEGDLLVRSAAPFVMLLIYLPALVILLPHRGARRAGIRHVHAVNRAAPRPRLM